MKKYIGNIRNLDKILVTDPIYEKDVTCRYEKNFNTLKNFNIELAINEVDEPFDDSNYNIRIQGIEFTLLLQNPIEKNVSKKLFISNNNNICYWNKVSKKESYEIGMDSASIFIGTNNCIDDEWSLSTLTDGYFGYVTEYYCDNNLLGISLTGYFDKDTDITENFLLQYLTQQFNIENIKELEIEQEEEL